MILRLLVFFLNITLCWSAQPSFQVQLVNQATHVQDLERDLARLEINAQTLMEQEKDAYIELSHHQHHMVAAIQNAKVWRDFSPAFVSVSSRTMTDLVHSYVVLENLIPRLNEKNQEIFPVVKKIAAIKKNMADAKNYTKDLTHAYEQAFKELLRLLDEKNKVQPPKASENTRVYASVGQLIAALQKTVTNGQNSVHEETVLLPPSVGERTVLQAADGVKNLFKTRPDSLVVAPWSGVVVYVGSVGQRGHVVVIQQDSFYVVLLGLGSVYAYEGQHVLSGEPVGRMASLMKISAQKTDKPHTVLTMQLYKGVMALDPAPYFKSNL